jgi:hypothetical protein
MGLLGCLRGSLYLTYSSLGLGRGHVGGLTRRMHIALNEYWILSRFVEEERYTHLLERSSLGTFLVDTSPWSLTCVPLESSASHVWAY